MTAVCKIEAVYNYWQNARKRERVKTTSLSK